MGFSKIKKSMDSTKIEKAIEIFEQKIDFEFIPVIAKKSSYTEHVLWILSLLFLICFIGIIEYIFNQHAFETWQSPFPFYLGSPFVSFVLAFVISHFNFIKRFFIPKQWQIRQVQEKSELFFYRHHLHDLKTRHALVLYISILEHYIVLIHDPRIKMESMNSIDQKILSIIQSSFKSKNYESGLLQSIEVLQSELADYYERDNTQPHSNQVPNKIVWLEEV